MRRRTKRAIVVMSSVVVLAAGFGAAAEALGIFVPQVNITVINDGPHPVSLTCLWDNRSYLRAGGRTTLPVEGGSVEDCEVDDLSTGGDLGCLVLDARGTRSAPHDILTSSALPDTAETNCSI